MNKLNIASTGYPGTTESWKFIKDTYEMIADALGKVIDINDAVILSGMEVTGSDISDGYLSYNGEIYAFKGGEFTGTIVLVEDVTNVEYNTDPANSGQLQSLPTYYKRYARNGQAGEGFKDIAYDDFVRLDSLIDISERTKQATETKKGIAEIATQADIDDGTNNEKIVTPAKLQYGLDNMPMRIYKKFQINPVACNFGQKYSSSQLFDLGSNIGQNNYMVIGTFNDNSLGSPQPVLFTLYTMKADNQFEANWVLDATGISGSGTVSGWVDLIVVVF